MLKNDKEFYKICFDTLLEGICITDNKGVIVMNNSSLEDVFGYKSGELKNKKIDILIPEIYRNSHQNHFTSYFKKPKKFKKGKGRDFFGLHKNGKVINVEIGLNYFEYKDKIYAKALITDISTRKEEELKIRNLNLGLELELTQQTKELTHAVVQLKKSNRTLKEEIQKKILAENKAQQAFQKEKELNLLQTKFLSVASHEFKTPLSGILTSTTLIDKYKNTGQYKNIEKHIQTIKKLVNQLNSVLDDFLFLEKTETEKVNYQFYKFHFCDFFEDIINNSKTVLKDGQKIEFIQCNSNVEVYQDKTVLNIIIRNILYNAIKYSPVNSTIKIKVNTNDNISILIEDNGIGIPLDDQKHIFKRFFRAKNALHFQGTGIGLNIVKHHIEELGGSISFKSIENKGTIVNVKLPIVVKKEIN